MADNMLTGVQYNPVPNSNVDSTLNANYNNASADELYEACKSFETYFIEQIFKKMQDSVERTTEKGDYEKMFEDKLNTEYSTAATEQGGIGLAQILYDQMKVNFQ